MKKKIALMLSLVMMIATMSVSVSAAEISRTNGSNGFTANWSASVTDGNASMVYGFNTNWINEDYTWTNHSTTSHTAIVKNDNGQHTANASKGNWAKIEVTHKGTAITYTMVY